MSKILDFIKTRPGVVICITALLVAIGIVSAMQGCNLASTVKVDVPQYVKTAIAETPEDIDREYSLAEIDGVVYQWNHYIEINTERLQVAIDDANERYAFLSIMANIGLDAVSAEASNIPGGALLLSGLSLISGLFLKRPGEDARVSKEKQASYNKGLEVGAAIVSKPVEKPTDSTAV